ncbi:MAG: DUF1778 domain-containing protein [Acidimicrobiia bacterium]
MAIAVERSTATVFAGVFMPPSPNRTRSERIEVRATREDRALIDRAVAASGTDLTEFVLTSLTVASYRVLADRTEFALGPDALEAWEAVGPSDHEARQGCRCGRSFRMSLVVTKAVTVHRRVTGRY